MNNSSDRVTQSIPVAAMLLIFLLPFSLTAQDNGNDSPDSPLTQETRFGLGFQSTYPAWGISGTYDINEQVTLQAVISPFGVVGALAGRALYNFKQDDYWNFYGYGMAGLWRHGRFGTINESALGLGAGAGFQFDWRGFDDDLPPILWNIELGGAFIDFDHYNYSPIVFGGGFHYRF
jgi:hypothetical protein